MARNGKDHPSPRFWVIAAGIAVGTGLVGYGGGRLQASAQTRAAERRVTEAQDRASEELRAAESRHEASSAAAREDRSVLQSKARALLERERLLESRRQLGLVLISLDDRNFGIASRHLERATTALRSAQLEEGRARALLASLTQAEVVVSNDLGDQRRELRSLIDDFDVVIDALPEIEIDLESSGQSSEAGDAGPVDEVGDAGPEAAEGGSDEGDAASAAADAALGTATSEVDGNAEPAP